ncbi:MAG: hypothetical protein ACYC2G_02185 [Gemmatimonadaceae bacterium]
MRPELTALFDAVEDEFGVTITAAARARLETPAALVAYVVEHLPPAGEWMDPEDREEHVTAVLGEVLARELGTSFYALTDRWPER